ncbi:clathrin heavy chain linker domain-containing 1-like [Brachionus plicatilis]|uniref:Clathrin heavy chain linker domain-containing 1-like n=1 Tax=Brachionus plicatilis TaxID=10195 RepID=A0A3M7SIM5_BRAPC|nr:clathrin heavy chain linker domain-containing 1-like [Brachionus plicatilis]
MEAGNTQNDDIFVSKVNRFIDEELSRIEQHVSTYDRRSRFLIFKEALNKIIEYAQIYRNLLIDIKKGYEYCIDVFENQNVNVKEKIDELLKYKSYPETISNLKKSKLEFLQKFDRTKFYTQELEQKLESIIEKNEKFRPKKNTNKFEFLIAKEKKESDQEENKKIVISGLSLDKTTDLVHLDFLLKEIEYKIKELSVAQAEKYSNKQQKKDLEVN